MKKHLRLALFAVLVLALVLTLGMMASAAEEGATTKEEDHQYSITDGGTTKYYVTLKAAVEAVPDNGTVLVIVDEASDVPVNLTSAKTYTISGGSTMKKLYVKTTSSKSVADQACTFAIGNGHVTLHNLNLISSTGTKASTFVYIYNGLGDLPQRENPSSLTFDNVISTIPSTYGIWANGVTTVTVRGSESNIRGGSTNLFRGQYASRAPMVHFVVEDGVLDGSISQNAIFISNHQTLTVTGGTIIGGTNTAIWFMGYSFEKEHPANTHSISGATIITAPNSVAFTYTTEYLNGTTSDCPFNVEVSDCEIRLVGLSAALIERESEFATKFKFAKIASGKIIIDGGQLPDESYDQWVDWTKTTVVLTNFAVDSITTAGTWNITSMNDIEAILDGAISGGIGDAASRFPLFEFDTSAIPKTLVINHPDAIVNIAEGEYLAYETLIQVKAGTLNITGGAFASPSTEGGNGAYLFLIENGTINIGGGDFSAACVLRTLDVVEGNSVLVNVTAGNFISNAKVSSSSYMFSNTSHGAVFNISGGVFKAGIKNQSIVAIESARGDKKAEAPTINISGGSFELGLSWIYLNAAGVINVMPHASGDASKDPVFSEVSYAGEGAQDREPYAVYMTSNCLDGVINISGGTMSISNAAVDLIYASVGTLNISGGSLNGVYRVIDLSGGNPANVNISGGTLTAVREKVIYFATASSSKTIAAVTITGGTFVAAANNGEIGYLSSAAPNLSFVIKGGTFISESVRLFYLGKGSKIAFTIEGGEFSTTASRMFYVEQNETPMVIKGGTFTLLENGEGKAENAIVYMAGREYAIVNVMGGTFFDERAGSNQVFYKQNEKGVINFSGSYTVYSKNAKPFTYLDTDNEGMNSFKLPATQVTPAGKDSKYYVCIAYQNADGPSMVGVPVLRANEGAMGLRFTSVVPATTVAKLSGKGTVSYGTIIFPAEYISALDGNTTDVLAALKAYANANNLPESKVFVNIVADKGVSSDEAGNVTIRASLVNIKESNYGKDFMAISYAKATNKRGQSTYYYASFNTGFYGNVSEAAEYAYNDIYEMAAQKEDGRIYAYKFIEDEFLFSRFSAKQQNEMKKYFAK